MKKLYFLCLTMLMASFSFAQTSDLLFSKYGEGSSNNKFLEIYNGTGADVDLSNYSLSSCSGGCDTFNEFDFPDNVTFDAGTMLADGEVYIIAHPSADAIILAEADQTFTFLSNGDDAFALTLAGATAATYTIIDLIGDLQGDPGSGWEVAGEANGTQNATLTRKSSICSPNPSELGSFGTDAATSEWVVGASNSGWDTLGSFTGCNTTPIVTITSPGDNSVVASGTTSVDIEFNAENAPGGSTFNISVTTNGGAPVVSNGVTSPFTITPTADGDTFAVTVDLVDGGVLASDTTNFNIAYPCDLQVGTITETCDAITPATTDTYSVTIEYTGGGTSTYTIDTGGIGTVGGDDPSTVADGTITITGVTENTDFTVTFTGDMANSGCDFTRNINSPDCDPQLTLPLYEGFDYTVAEDLGAQGNWESFNGGDIITIGGPGGLTYSGLANDAQTGNHVSFDGSGMESKIEFAPVDSGKIYTSFLLNVTDISAVTDLADGGYIAALAASDSGYDARVWVRPLAPVATRGGDPYEISITTLSSGGNGAPFTGTYNVGDTVLIVMSYEPTTGALNGWINPTALGGTEPAADFTETDSNPASMIDRFVLRQDSANETAFVLFDELRIGTTYAEVTPQTLSNDEFTLSELAMYPNPTHTGFVTIKSSSSDAMNVQVYDILGKQVKNETVSNNTLNVSNLNTGVYIVKITQNNASVTKKLVIR